MSTPDPAKLQAAIQEGYLRYFDTAFWLRDDPLMTERPELLQQAGNVFQDALIEPVPTYLTGPTILEVCEGLQLNRSMADQLAAMLFDSDCQFEPWVHQAQSLRVSLSRGGREPRNVIVTSGTGSGKTQCVLLPVFARLLSEARTWSAQPDLVRWWDTEGEPWRDCRADQTRDAAVRTMILYPTNALVEDQVSRLRRAVEKAGGEGTTPGIFFGRYTSATLGLGDMPRRRRQPTVRRVAREPAARRALRGAAVRPVPAAPARCR